MPDTPQPPMTSQASTDSSTVPSEIGNKVGNNIIQPSNLANSIFVSIASYRDPDCKNTVRDLFAKASQPERVFIGVCLQAVPGDDEDCLLHKLWEEPAMQAYQTQVRILQVHASESQGACWARSKVQELFQDEAYYLQVDSHMRFVPDWDQAMIQMLANCGSEKAVLSTYPLSFTPPDKFAEHGIVTIHPKAFSDQGILAQRSTLASMKHAPAKPAPVYLIGAGLVFSHGRLVREVPYDPYLYFEGEEISLAVRFWTHGWDIFTPNQVLAWHDYGRRPERARHWKDQTDWTALNRRALARIGHLLGIKSKVKEDYLQDIARYGLGTERSLLQYQQAAELDFAAHCFQGQPLPNSDSAANQDSQHQARREIFTSIWANNAWCCEETRSGNGSSLAETVAVRKWLPGMLQNLGCCALADVGCGDLHWIEEILPQLRFYFGYDIVPGLIGDLRQRYHQRSNCFFSEADMVLQPPPQADVILCRDMLTHLPLDAVQMCLRQFKQSRSQYLIATTHDRGPSEINNTHNRWISNGAWQALDLCAAPFNLPAPRHVCREGGKKLLGVWACEDLPDW